MADLLRDILGIGSNAVSFVKSSIKKTKKKFYDDEGIFQQGKFQPLQAAKETARLAIKTTPLAPFSNDLTSPSFYERTAIKAKNVAQAFKTQTKQERTENLERFLDKVPGARFAYTTAMYNPATRVGAAAISKLTPQNVQQNVRQGYKNVEQMRSKQKLLPTVAADIVTGAPFYGAFAKGLEVPVESVISKLLPKVPALIKAGIVTVAGEAASSAAVYGPTRAVLNKEKLLPSIAKETVSGVTGRATMGTFGKAFGKVFGKAASEYIPNIMHPDDIEFVKNFKRSSDLGDIKTNFKAFQEGSGVIEGLYKQYVQPDAKLAKQVPFNKKLDELWDLAAAEFRGRARPNIQMGITGEGQTGKSASQGQPYNPKPKTTLLEKAQILENSPKTQQALQENQASAEIAQTELSKYSPEEINLFNRIKKMASSRAFQEGDIETLRKRDRYGIVEKAIQAVKNQESDYQAKYGSEISDEDALNKILSMPTKAETKVQTPEQIQEAKKLRQEANKLRDFVYSGEASPETKAKLIQKNQKTLEANAKAEFDEWMGEFRNKTLPRTPKVQAEGVARGIQKSTRSALSNNAENLSDISPISTGMRDLYRNFKKVYGKTFETAKKVILDPFDNSKKQLFEETDKLLNELDNNVVKKFNIDKGSKESAAIQELGEGKRDGASLVKEFGRTKARQIVQADRWFRETYDKLLEEVNVIRAKIYPNNPKKIIPKRQDYYRHFREMAEGFAGLKNIFETSADISSKLAGVSYQTQPKSKWASFMQQRLGDKSEIDAVGGFLDYIKAATYAKHIDQHIPRFRAVAQELSDSTQNSNNLNNFILFLNRFADDLSGKTNPMDRWIQESVGRKPIAALNWVNSRVKANVILGNLFSSLAQFFNVPQGMAQAGHKYWAKGASDTLQQLFAKGETPMNQSGFLKERYFNSYDRFDKGLINDAKKFAVWITQSPDELGTKYIWNMNYQKALDEGIPNAIKYADDITRNMVAGRGIGEVPLNQKSKVFQLLAPFQLEVANLWWVMKDFVDEKKFGKLVSFLTLSYVFNRAAKQIRGSDVSFDPINAIIEGSQAYSEEENKKIGAMRFGGRVAGEVLSNLPGGQTVATLYPEYGVRIGGENVTRKELFGEGDPTRFGSGLLATQAVTDPLFKLFPPFGGQQIKRTIQGVSDVNKGYSESRSGLVQYPIEKKPLSYIKAATIGKQSLSEAQAYFGEDRRPLGKNQSAYFKQADAGEQKAYYNELISERQTNKTKNAIKEELKASDKDFTQQGEKYYFRDGTKIKTIDLSELIQKPEKGIKSYEQQDKQFALARKVYEGEGVYGKFPKELKEKIYKRLGLKKEEIAYDYLANKETDIKVRYILDQIDGFSHEQVIEGLLKGRVESISGKVFITDTVLGDLKDEGIITNDEYKYLKTIELDKEGKFKKGTTPGGSKKAKKPKELPTIPKLGDLVVKSREAQSLQSAKPIKVDQPSEADVQLSKPSIPKAQPISVEQLIANTKAPYAAKARAQVEKLRGSSGGGGKTLKLSRSRYRPS